MENRNYTTLEQARRLVELGLNPDTADMYFLRVTGETYNDGTGEVNPLTEDNTKVYVLRSDGRPDFEYPEDDMHPCWSVGALMQQMPVVDECTYRCVGTLDHNICVEFDHVTNVIYQESPIDAFFYMIEWLFEKGIMTK